MNILKLILPLCLLLPSSAIISQTATAQVQCTEYANGTECRRSSGQLEAACQTSGRFSTCQTYHKMWCQLGQPAACDFFNLSVSNPRYYQQLITANKFCTGGNQQACNWLRSRGH